MKEKIERLAKGIFEYEMPELLVSESHLHVYVEAGLKTEGSFCVKNKEGIRMKGVLYVTGKLLVLKDTNFVGTECELLYSVDAKALQAGDVHTGSISIISDCGERQLPFSIHVTDPVYESSVGEIKDMFQFTNLARMNWREAVEFFVSSEFPNITLRKDAKALLAYEQLMESPDKDRALEEFLVFIHKKKRCEFKISQETLELTAGNENYQEQFTVKKEQWGYLHFSVTTTSAHIVPAKTEYVADDFVNGQAEISFVVNAQQMKPGKHYAEIICKDARQEFRVPVVVHKYKDDVTEYPWKSAKKMEHKLFAQYLKFRNNEAAAGVYLAESGRILESLLALLDREAMDGETPEKRAQAESKRQIYELYHAYLAIADTKNKNKEDVYEAALRKRSYFERNGQMRSYCATLYLESMKTRSNPLTTEYADRIRVYYERDRKDALLLWFLLYMDKRMESNRSLRYESIRMHCKSGNYSPILLYEAAAVWCAEPAMVHMLTSFECHVMQYLLKSNMITKELALQFAYLSEKNKENEKLQLHLLKQLYKKFPHKDILSALCKKIIALDCRETRMHGYLQQGVREQLRIDGLYEAYFYTLCRTAETSIDQQALLYFSYSNTLSEEDNAFIYAYVVRNKDNNPAIYRAYLKKMEQFAVNQMKAGVTGDNLSVLYADVLRASIIDREMAQTLPDIIFTYCLECKNAAMESVCVAHKEEKSVYTVPLTVTEGKKSALVPIYTEDAVVFLVDGDGNRYLMTETDKLYRLMHVDNLLEICYEIGSDNRRLLLYIEEKNKNYNTHNKMRIDLQKQLSGMSGIKDEVKNACVMSLVEYYYENYDGELLESYLQILNLELLSTKDRERIMELMVLRDMYDEVIGAVEKFGCETMQNKRMAKLCVKGIYSPREERDREILLSMGIHAFHTGRVEERLLQYLIEKYNGTTAEMYELWVAARRQELDTSELEERLLGQMLFAESYVDDSFSVFLSYYGTGLNRKLIRAYLSYCAYKYFVKDRMTNQQMFEILKRETFLESSQICVLALLKYYSGKKELSEAEKNFVEYHIQRFVQKKMVFSFFKEFVGQLELPACVADKYYVEYRTNPKNKVTLHYSCSLDEELKEEAMTDIGYGIYVKELILFYGESLQYFISQENESGVEMVESRMVQYTEVNDAPGNTKYEKINEILLTQELKDEKTLYSLLEKYAKTEYAVKRHFSPV